VPGSQIPFTRASEQDRATLDLIAVMPTKRAALREYSRHDEAALNTSQEVQRKNVQYDGGFPFTP
jgi:hypothetical protein